jgi:hypothetical protein
VTKSFPSIPTTRTHRSGIRGRSEGSAFEDCTRRGLRSKVARRCRRLHVDREDGSLCACAIFVSQPARWRDPRNPRGRARRQEPDNRARHRRPKMSKVTHRYQRLRPLLGVILGVRAKQKLFLGVRPKQKLFSILPSLGSDLNKSFFPWVILGVILGVRPKQKLFSIVGAPG